MQEGMAVNIIISLAVTSFFYLICFNLEDIEKIIKSRKVQERYSEDKQETTRFLQYNLIQKMACFEKLEAGEVSPKDFKELFIKEVKEKQLKIFTLSAKDYLKNAAPKYLAFFIRFIGFLLCLLALSFFLMTSLRPA